MLGLLKGIGIIIGIELALVSCPLECEIKLKTPVLNETLNRLHVILLTSTTILMPSGKFI